MIKRQKTKTEISENTSEQAAETDQKLSTLVDDAGVYIRQYSDRHYSDPDSFGALSGANYFSYYGTIPFGYVLSKLALILLAYIIYRCSLLKALSEAASLSFYFVSIALLFLPVLCAYAFRAVKTYPSSDYLAALVILAAFLLSGKNNTAFWFAAIFTFCDALSFFIYSRAYNVREIRYEFSLSSLRFVSQKKKGVITPGDKVRFSAGEACPADAKITSGEIVCKFVASDGDEVPSILKSGDDICSGTEILTGEAEAVFVRGYEDSFANRITERYYALAYAHSGVQRRIITAVSILRVALIICVAFVFSTGFGKTGFLPTALALLCATLCDQFLCALNAIYSHMISSLADMGIFPRRKDDIAKAAEIEICIIPEKLLLEKLKCSDVKLSVDMKLDAKREFIHRVLDKMTEATTDAMFIPLKEYCKKNEFILNSDDNAGKILSGMRFVSSSDGKYITYSLGSHVFSLVAKSAAGASVITRDNAFDGNTYELIYIYYDKKPIGYIKYDFTEGPYINQEQTFENPDPDRIKYVSEEKFKAAKEIYISSLVGDHIKNTKKSGAAIARVLEFSSEKGEAVEKDFDYFIQKQGKNVGKYYYGILCGAKDRTEELDGADLVIVPETLSCLDETVAASGRFKSSAVTLAVISAVLSVLILFLYLLTHSFEFVLFAMAVKAISQAMYLYIVSEPYNKQ